MKLKANLLILKMEVFIKTIIKKALEPVKAKSTKRFLQQYIDNETKIKHRIENRIRFLKNPRYPLPKAIATLIGNPPSDKPLPSRAVSKPGDIIAIPEIIIFNKYNPKQVLSKTLEIKNKTGHAHRFHVPFFI